MKILAGLFLTLAFACYGYGQKTAADLEKDIKLLRNNKRYSVEYDKFKDRTWVRFSSFSMYPAKESRGMGIPRLGLSFSFEGEELKSEVDKFYFVFWSVSSKWIYLRNRDLIFLADDSRISLGDGNHKGEVERKGVSEILTHSVDRSDLEKIAASTQTEFKLGAFESSLTDEHKQMLKDMLSLSKK